jgi:predicted signal transduction protein with EAL and GGDEF domain
MCVSRDRLNATLRSPAIRDRTWIESKDQLEVLRQLGCRRGQGYLVARPMEPAAFRAFIGDRSPAAGRDAALHPDPDAGRPRVAAAPVEAPIA